MTEEKIFWTWQEEAAMGLFTRINHNKKLLRLELEGFARGIDRKKTMDVSIQVLNDSLHKQYLDFLKAYGNDDHLEMKRCLADLRNVAGCFFLKLEETQK